MENNRVEGNKRISVFSFGRDWVVPDFIFFIAVVVIYGIIVTQYELTQVRANSVETVITIVGDISSFIPVAIVLTFIFEGGATSIMIFWRWYMQKQEAEIQQAKADGITEGETRGLAKGRVEGEAVGRAEGQAVGRAEGQAVGRAEGQAVGRAEGQAIGRTETYQLWSSWNIRRIEAERQNLPFDEPPPPLPEVTAE